MAKYNKETMDYVDGFGVHWYWDEFIPPNVLDQTHLTFPSKIILNTESSFGDKPYQEHKPILGSWSRGEAYVKDVIENLNHWVAGYIDWNLILNEEGGPNYVDNFVDSAVIMNRTSKSEFYKQPIFYAIGHLSKFIPQGSVRISCKTSNIFLQSTAFLRPDKLITIVLFNSLDTIMDVTIQTNGKGKIFLVIPKRSISTILYK